LDAGVTALLGVLRGAVRGSGSSEIRSRLVGGAAGTVVLNGFTLGLNFMTVLVLSRLLGASAFGTYAFAFAWAMLLSVPAMLGLNSIVIRNVAAYEATSKWALLRGIIQRSQQLVGATSFVIVAIAAVVGWLAYRGDYHVLGPLWIALLLVPVISLTAMRQAAMQGLGKVVLGRTPEAVVGPALLLALVGLGYLMLGGRLSATWAAGLNAGSSLAALSLGGYLLFRSLPDEARGIAPAMETRAWLRSARPLLLSTGVLALNAQIGTILLGAMEGTADAGVFNATLRLANFTNFLFAAATYPLMPLAARLWAAGEVRRLERVLRQSSRTIVLVSAVVGGILFAFAAPILGLFGAEFTSGAGALRILVCGQLVSCMTGYAGIALVMAGHERAFAKATTVGVAMTVALTAALIPAWQVEGAAVGLAAGLSTTGVLATVLLWRRLGLYVGAFRFFGEPPR
jgi:O-antigen/teichoic acid export membrane protein